MKTLIHQTPFGICLAALFLSRTDASVFEDWNDLNNGSNNWFYFDETDDDDHGNVALDWHPSGGIDNSPHVSCPLENLTDWTPQTPADAYFPLYAIDVHHSVNLIENPRVSIAVRDMDAVNLHGGALFFWVGEWIDEDDYHFVYFNGAAFTPAAEWKRPIITTTADPEDWTLLGEAGANPDLATLLSAPQQWGFTIRGGSAAPSGRLGFDNLIVVPEPRAFVPIFAFAALALLWRRRRLRKR